MNSLRESLFKAGLVSEKKVRDLNQMQRIREELARRLLRSQAVRPKGWRQTVIDFLIPARSANEFRRVALNLIMYCPEAIGDVVDASYIFKNERGGVILIRQVDEVRRNIEKYDDFHQRRLFLLETLGFRRRSVFRVVR